MEIFDLILDLMGKGGSLTLHWILGPVDFPEHLFTEHFGVQNRVNDLPSLHIHMFFDSLPFDSVDHRNVKTSLSFTHRESPRVAENHAGE